jgi:hypothetical protein
MAERMFVAAVHQVGEFGPGRFKWSTSICIYTCVLKDRPSYQPTTVTAAYAGLDLPENIDNTILSSAF